MSTRLQYSFGSIALFLGAFFFFPSLVSAATPVAGGLGPDAHWTLEGSPYIVQFHNIFSGAGNAIGDTLTIDPGVVVKFEPGSQFLPGGTMIARGTSDQPIIFTSLFDDAADGQDSDGLGPTTGTVGDWYRISGGDPTIDFDHVQMRYSTLGLQLYFSTQPVSITNSLFRDNSYGIMLAYGSDQILVENSTFRNNGRGFELLAMTNTANFIRNNNIYDNQVYGAENLTPDRIVDMRGNFWGHATGPFHPTNNPSGQGDQVNDGILFDPWLESETGKSRIDPVIIIPGILGSSQKNGVFVIDPIMHVYDNLLDTLEANGYQRGVSLFTFPYNWRNSNVDTALLLRDKIDLVQEICQCDKVDVVAHSMGGLVARQYVQSENYEEDIDQMMFLGTPHFGAPKSYLAWEGSHVGFGLPDKFLALSLTREGRKLGYDSLFDYMRNRPISSLQETLPIYDYLKDDDTGDLRPYPDNYPQNSFLENLDDSFGSLLSSGIELFNIIGNTGEATISTIRVVDSPGLPLWEHGYPEGLNEKIGDRGLELGEGDGTVPQISSVISDQTLQISTDHIELVTQAEGIVYKTLTGNDPIVLINDPLKVPNVLLAISMLSPADFQVIAPDGKKIGKDFLTGAEINEIEGAFYSGFVTDDEYVTIPDPLDGEYRVITEGTDNGGAYTVAVGYISEDDLAEKEFSAQTLPGVVTELNISVNNANPEALDIESEDQTPPQITVLSPVQKDYIRSELLPINVEIEDIDTGVFSSLLMLDDIIVEEGDIVDLFYINLGGHTFIAEATDFVGNISSRFVNFRVIATLQSTVSDIQRAYLLGWISDPAVKDSLVSKLQPLIKHGKRLDKSTAKSFLSLLDAQRGKSINEQAYELLKEDINWLLNN